jgi:hypothetical protein
VRLSGLFAELGEKAIDRLNKSGEKGDFWLFSIKSDLFTDNLRDDPRFQELLRKAGFAPKV